MNLVEINARVSIYRCKKCFNPHEGAEGPKFLPWAMSSYGLNKYSERSPPFHLTAEDVCMELDNYRIKPTSFTKHRILILLLELLLVLLPLPLPLRPSTSTSTSTTTSTISSTSTILVLVLTLGLF